MEADLIGAQQSVLQVHEGLVAEPRLPGLGGFLYKGEVRAAFPGTQSCVGVDDAAHLALQEFDETVRQQFPDDAETVGLGAGDDVGDFVGGELVAVVEGRGPDLAGICDQGRCSC